MAAQRGAPAETRLPSLGGASGAASASRARRDGVGGGGVRRDHVDRRTITGVALGAHRLRAGDDDHDKEHQGRRADGSRTGTLPRRGDGSDGTNSRCAPFRGPRPCVLFPQSFGYHFNPWPTDAHRRPVHHRALTRWARRPRLAASVDRPPPSCAPWRSRAPAPGPRRAPPPTQRRTRWTSRSTRPRRTRRMPRPWPTPGAQTRSPGRRAPMGCASYGPGGS